MSYYIGTSGWAHKDWGKKFFPKDVPQRLHLSYLAEHFNTVEINATFYRNQPESSFVKWKGETPADFVFATKISRYLTHIKRLKKIQPYWGRFVEPSAKLAKKRGPMLLQLPPSWDSREEHLQRITNFLKEAKKIRGLKIAVELRNKGSFTDEMLDVLRKHGAALVIANSGKYPNPPIIATAPDFVYFRLHGPRKLFASAYQDDELKEWAKHMRKFHRQGKDVYVYFNNDQHAYAPANAQLLQKLVGYKR